MTEKRRLTGKMDGKLSDRQEAFKKQFLDLLHVPFAFEDGGTRVLYYKAEDYEIN